MMVQESSVWTDEGVVHSDGVAIGLDIGTTNSCVSVWIPEKGRAKTIKCVETGRKTVKSIAWLDRGTNKLQVVGDKALDMKDGMGVLLQSTKRFIGRRFQEVTTDELDHLPYGLCHSTFKKDQILVGCAEGAKSRSMLNDGITPESVCTALVSMLRDMAENYLDKKVTMAVITVPAFFNERQRSATKAAAEAAGLKVLRLLSEPMAAAMSYGLFVAGKKKVAIVDMGGGTFDVSLLSIENGKFEALALGGNNALGGDDVDNLLVDYTLSKMENGPGSASKLSFMERNELKMHCEEAKIKLSQQNDAWITDSVMITRSEFEKLVKPLEEKVRKIIGQTLTDAKLMRQDIDEVVLVGLSTEMPWLRKTVQDIFQVPELCTNVPGDRAVSQGAAIQAAIMSGADSYTLSKILMLDALPYTIGLETGDGKFAPLLARNSKIPCSASRVFTTHRDFQRAVTIDVFEGEEPIAKSNRWVGHEDFSVEGGSTLEAGEASIHVTFTVTADGTLVINAETEPHAPTKPKPEINPILLPILVLLVAIFIAVKAMFVVENQNLESD